MLQDALGQAYAQVLRRNGGETEFPKAVHECLSSLAPLAVSQPALFANGLLERLCEPERQIVFRVPWVDDGGRVHVNRGYRVQFNSALGPYKGGLRFHPSVTLDLVKSLAFEQTFKNALTGMMIGGAKGGADFDPHGRSDGEVMRFCQSFMSELQRHIGSETDAPAGDIGVGVRELGFLFGQYKRLTNRFDAGALTGKGLGWGGMPIRSEATGYGLCFFVARMLATRGLNFEGRRVVVSGSGNVALHAAEKAQQLGGRVVAMSDSSGFIIDEAGIDIALMKSLKQDRRARIAVYAQERAGAAFHAAGSIWSTPCDIALPAATQNELGAEGARQLVANGVIAVGEGANCPATPEAIAIFRDADVLFAPGKAANAGGVATSALEMRTHLALEAWDAARTQAWLQRKMEEIHDTCAQTADAFGLRGDYVAGANMAGFLRVAAAMQSLGVV